MKIRKQRKPTDIKAPETTITISAEPSRDPERLLDTRAAAPYVGVSAETLGIWRALKKPDQPRWVKCGRAVRYRPSDLAAYQASRVRGPG